MAARDRLGDVDLRPYNVLVIPGAWKTDALRRALEPHKKALDAWIRSGGPLIAMGSSAACSPA